MPQPTAISGQQQVIRRINRYSTLRGAERALYPSLRLRPGDDAHGPGVGVLMKLRKMLLDLHAAGAPTPDLPERLDEVDLQLATMSERVRTALSDISMAQLRATLPPIARDARGEATALLDFCIDADGVSPGYVPLVEYLVTLLSSSGQRGAQIVRCDPTRVTAAVERICTRGSASADAASERAARELASASFEVTGLRDLVPLVGRMRAIKGELGTRLFTSELLRCAVTYNLAVANRVEALMDLERLRDREERRILDALQALDGPGAASGVDWATRRPSVLVSPGLHSVCEALRDRLAGVEPAPGPSAKIAAQIDVSGLHAHEVRAFTDGLDDGAAPLLRTAVVVADVIGDLPSLTEPLRQLDIDPLVLERDWVAELDGALTETAGQLADCGRAAEAGVFERARARLSRD